MSFPTLTFEELRVLSVLIEKDMATPEYYPMTPNALVNGCNQKTNRDPMTAFDEELVTDTLDALRAKQLVEVLTGGGNRVPKWSHRVSEMWIVTNRELAVLCVMMLRGAQTLNELKTRTESLYKFSDFDAVESVLHRLAERGVTQLLPKTPGMREPRWTHLLMGEPVIPQQVATDAIPSAPSSALADRVTKLEAEIEALRTEFAEFRRQFQ
ncbi:MAG: DUF480 domain-containing protein [Acidobacteria bacterium]|nr:DUF480 domain-containing protein [Acidobacteriota bacterium]